MLPDTDNQREGVSNLSILSSSGSWVLCGYHPGLVSNYTDGTVEIKKNEEAGRRKEPCLLYRVFYAESERAGGKTDRHDWVIERGSPLLVFCQLLLVLSCQSDINNALLTEGRVLPLVWLYSQGKKERGLACQKHNHLQSSFTQDV